MMDLSKYKEEVYNIIGAAMAVYNELGWGLLESVYNEALSIELRERNIDCETEKNIECFYKQYKLKKHFRLDLATDDVIIELKAVDEISSAHRSQLFNYLRLTKVPIGLIINFGQHGLYGERYCFDKQTNQCILLDKNLNPFYSDK